MLPVLQEIQVTKAQAETMDKQAIMVLRAIMVSVDRAVQQVQGGLQEIQVIKVLMDNQVQLVLMELVAQAEQAV